MCRMAQGAQLRSFPDGRVVDMEIALNGSLLGTPSIRRELKMSIPASLVRFIIDSIPHVG
jgi:hypothetical protein